MPHEMWHHGPCCSRASSWTTKPECWHCGQLGTYDGWHLSMHEQMARYQYVYRVKPMGPHRNLTHELLSPLRTDCPRCDGRGVLALEGGNWRGCVQCEGTGGSWAVPDEEVQAAYARVIKEFPDAAAPDGPAEFLTGAVVFDLGSGLMLGALHPTSRTDQPVLAAAHNSAPAQRPKPVAVRSMPALPPPPPIPPAPDSSNTLPGVWRWLGYCAFLALIRLALMAAQ